MGTQRESLNTLPVGTQVYYTGDMANQPAEGTIVGLLLSRRIAVMRRKK